MSGPADDTPLRFGNERKLRKRGWTEDMIRDAIRTTPEPWNGQLGPAWRYRHPETGMTVLVDAATGEIFHVGAARFKYED